MYRAMFLAGAVGVFFGGCASDPGDDGARDAASFGGLGSGELSGAPRGHASDGEGPGNSVRDAGASSPGDGRDASDDPGSWGSGDVTGSAGGDGASPFGDGSAGPSSSGGPSADAGDAASGDPTSSDAGAGMSVQDDDLCKVVPVTDEFRLAYGNLDPFYQKRADANGLPVISSNEPADLALTRACLLVIDMLSGRDDVRAQLVRDHIRFAIIGESELTNDIPEYSDLPDSINTRARGLGGLPAGSCAEESILCNTSRDLWRGEGICVHEFAHVMSMGGLYKVDPTFEGRLRTAYQTARASGILDNTYRIENEQEYFAEGAQDWYYTNHSAQPADGIHNWVDTPDELFDFDPVLYGLVGELLPADPRYVDCYAD